MIPNGKIQKTDQVSSNIVENRDDASDDDNHGTTEEQEQNVEDIEEELKTSGSFNMKKFREKLKSGDFITGKNLNSFCVFIDGKTISILLKSYVTFFKKLQLIPV